MLYLKNLYTQLLQPDDKIVGYGVPAIKGFSVPRHIRGKSVRPLIVGPGNSRHTFDGPQILQRGACVRRENLPIRLIEHHNLRRLRRRKDPEGAIGGDAALLYVRVHILLQLLLTEIPGEVGQCTGLFNFVSCIRIRGEDIRHGLRTNLAADGIPHRRLQVGNRTLGVALHIDPPFPAGCIVELLHQRIEGRLLRAVIVVPDRQGHRVLGIQGAFVSAAWQNKQQRRRQTYQTYSFHCHLCDSHGSLPLSSSIHKFNRFCLKNNRIPKCSNAGLSLKQFSKYPS